MNTYTITLDNSPKAKLFIELLKDMAFVKAIEPFSKIKSKTKKEKIDFNNIDTTELLMKDKKLVQLIEDYKKNGRGENWITFTSEEFKKYSKELLEKTQ